MLIKEVKYSYNDIEIVPSSVSDINSRSECNIYYKDGFLPLFAAPMSTVVSMENVDTLLENKIHPIIPRNIDYLVRVEEMKKERWVAFSLKEFQDIFCSVNNPCNCSYKVCIDCANGHMKSIFKSVKTAKQINPKLIVMIGNIANPYTYYNVWKCGADYVRCSIGNGSGCVTSTFTGVNYPQASLIDEIAELRRKIRDDYEIAEDKLPKVIADGGIKGFADINKALALGADYVMIGSVFASLLESPAETVDYSKGFTPISYDDLSKLYVYENDRIEYKFKDGDKTPILAKRFYGMASNNGSKDLNNKESVAPEGCNKEYPVKYTTSAWVDKFSKYLQSCMSYCNSKTLYYFVHATDTVIVSKAAHDSVNRVVG